MAAFHNPLLKQQNLGTRVQGTSILLTTSLATHWENLSNVPCWHLLLLPCWSIFQCEWMWVESMLCRCLALWPCTICSDHMEP